MKKVYFFLSFLSLAVLSCQKNDIVEQNESILLKTAFEPENFEEQLPSEYKIEWENYSSGYFSPMGEHLVEIPVQYFPINFIEPKNALVYKIIAVQPDKRGTKFDFYLVKFLNTEEIANVSIFDYAKFSGTVNVFDDTKVSVLSQLVSNGKIISSKNGKEPLNKYVQEDCYTVRTEHWIDWYNGYTGEYTHSTLEYVSIDPYCTGTGGDGSIGGSIGGIGGGSGGAGSTGGDGSTITMVERTEKKLDLKDEGPEVEEAITKDPSFKDTKADCVYEKLNSSSTSFSNALRRFDGEFPVANLKFSMADLPDNKRGRTYPPEDYLIEIQLNNDQTKNGVSYRPNLMTAKTIAHEIIHAEMFRKMLSLSETNGEIDESRLYSMLQNGDYPGMLDYYTRYGLNGFQHQQMAQHYRTTIGRILQEFNTGTSLGANETPDQFYLDLAWEGLNHSDITAWKDAISEEERDRIEAVISNYINNYSNEDCTSE